MSLRFMLDTNLCIRVLRDRPARLRALFNDEADALAISTIVLTHQTHGAAKSAKPASGRQAVDDLASRLEVLAFDEAASRHAGEIKADLERRGSQIGAYDVPIAGHARSRGLTLVTGTSASSAGSMDRSLSTGPRRDERSILPRTARDPLTPQKPLSTAVSH